jgi:hypothetical protein
MEWDELQKEAKTKGTLVFAMDQAQTPAMTQPGPWGTSFDGYCLGLAVQWVSYAYANKCFPTDASKVCDYPPWQATMSQTLSDTSADTVWPGRWKVTAAECQMTLSDGLRAMRNTKPTADFLYSIVTKAYGCYGVSLVSSTSAHAIALRHGKDNRMHLFDANYGHFSVRDHTVLKAFLSWSLKKSGYDTRYDKATRIVGIRPPIIAK